MTRWPGKPDEEVTNFGRLTRSQLMSRVRSSGNRTTEVELALLLRKAHLKGWRRHLPLPGSPDFAWPSQRVAVFVDGCFWHGHECGKNIHPRKNREVWRKKIERNRKRDRRVSRQLRERGWIVIRIWECRLTRAPGVCLGRIERALCAGR